ncbi:MAG: acetyl-CoA carboxylase biotin carboxyl carrier protein subunit [Bacteroidales bacterium]|nr:acetyl-CoA carboxylase biotin carboxyl carrier protein subunit [Bacteroidales bacterium]
MLVETGDEINKDTPLLIIESMKMENKIFSPYSGKIKEIYVKEGEQVKNNCLMIEIA